MQLTVAIVRLSLDPKTLWRERKRETDMALSTTTRIVLAAAAVSASLWAAGTSLFSVCESQNVNPGCWDSDVSANSCFLGASQLANTGFGLDSESTRHIRDARCLARVTRCRLQAATASRAHRLCYTPLMSAEQPISLQRRDHVAILTIDRPKTLNALSRETLYAFGRLGRELVADSDIRAIVITGAGDKAFCAGADLKERRGMSTDDIRVQVGLYRSELGVLDNSPKPVIAAINGVALGGGLELAMMCDLRVAVANAKLGLPETSLAIIPGATGTQRLPRLIGEGRANEMILLARRLSAAEALSWGLINRVVPEGKDLLDDVMEWIAPIAGGAPIAQAAALKAIRASYDVPLERGFDLEATYYDETLRSEDRLEALAAFADKRKPTFKGR